jgi:hypothetical protein
MSETFRFRNPTALALLIAGKMIGIGGLIVGSEARVLGGILLGIDGVCIVAAIAVSMRTWSERSREELSQKDVLRQLVKEGTLQQFLRDIEEERKAAEVEKKAAARERELEEAAAFERKQKRKGKTASERELEDGTASENATA